MEEWKSDLLLVSAGYQRISACCDGPIRLPEAIIKHDAVDACFDLVAGTASTAAPSRVGSPIFDNRTWSKAPRMCDS